MVTESAVLVPFVGSCSIRDFTVSTNFRLTVKVPVTGSFPGICIETAVRSSFVKDSIFTAISLAFSSFVLYKSELKMTAATKAVIEDADNTKTNKFDLTKIKTFFAFCDCSLGFA